MDDNINNINSKKWVPDLNNKFGACVGVINSRNQRRGVATGGVACDSVACCGAGARAQQMGVHVVVLVGLRSIDEVGGDAASAYMVG